MKFRWRNLKRSTRRRYLFYGGLIAALWGFYVYQPLEIEFFPGEAPVLKPADPDSNSLFSPGAKVIIITAHPDDSEFYTGGILARLAESGAELHQIICTDGDKGYYPWENASRNRVIRRREALDAARTWNGQTLEFLGYPDGRLRVKKSLVDTLADRIRTLKPDYILAFDPEYPPARRHQDHRLAGVAAYEAAKLADTGAWLMLFATRSPNYVADISDYWETQKKLLAIHASQFNGSRLELVTNLVEERAIEDGDLIRKNYGEGFRCLRVR
jgi:LmbE family N-acetylglucosaminyl deacetylase